MPNDDVTDPTSGGIPSDDQRPTVDQLIEENKRLRSKNANQEEEMRKAQSVVDVTRAIYKAPGGKEIIERARAAMDKGEELRFTPKEEKKLEKTAEAVGVTLEQVQSVLKQGLAEHEQSLSITNRANKAIAKLQERGKKEIPDFDKIYETDAFDRMMTNVLQLMQPTTDESGRQYAPALPVPEDEKDGYWFAMKHSAQMLTAGAKPPPDPRTPESTRRAAIAGQQTTSTGGPADKSDPDSPDLAWAKRRGSATIGKSFANS